MDKISKNFDRPTANHIRQTNIDSDITNNKQTNRKKINLLHTQKESERRKKEKMFVESEEMHKG